MSDLPIKQTNKLLRIQNRAQRVKDIARRLEEKHPQIEELTQIVVLARRILEDAST